MLGRKTRAALRQYQKSKGLAADGFPTASLLATLTRMPPPEPCQFFNRTVAAGRVCRPAREEALAFGPAAGIIKVHGPAIRGRVISRKPKPPTDRPSVTVTPEWPWKWRRADCGA